MHALCRLTAASAVLALAASAHTRAPLCAEQAERLTQFPECDAICRAAASAHVDRATR